MIFQEPVASLNPCFTVGFQIEESLRTHMGLSRGAARIRAGELLKSVHRECGGVWDWYSVANAPAPVAPAKSGGREERARAALTRFKPSFWDRLFEREETKEADLKDAVRDARQRGEADYQEEHAAYEQTRYDWEVNRQFAARVLAGDPVAYHEAIRVSFLFHAAEIKP